MPTAMNTVPNAKPPTTRCQSGFISNVRFDSLPMAKRSVDRLTAPMTTLSMIFQDPTPVTIRIAAPIRQASVDVSPIDPCMVPRKACPNVSVTAPMPLL